MKPTAGSDHEALAAANREAIRQIHPYQEPPRVPDPEVEGMANDELAGHSPDGRPADKPSWSKGRHCACGRPPASHARRDVRGLVVRRDRCSADGTGLRRGSHPGRISRLVRGTYASRGAPGRLRYRPAHPLQRTLWPHQPTSLIAGTNKAFDILNVNMSRPNLAFLPYTCPWVVGPGRFRGTLAPTRARSRPSFTQRLGFSPW